MPESRPQNASGSIGKRLETLMFRTTNGAHVGLYQLSGGKLGGRMFGSPVLVLTTTGRKSGKQRKTPLIYFQDGPNFVIVASKGGSPQDPVWWLNLKHTPEAEIQVGAKRMRVRAEQASPEERQRLWPLVTAMYKGYAEYQTKTTREIPVGILRPLT